MRRNRRKDVIIARIIFAAICVAIIAVIAAIIVVIASHNKKTPEKNTETQTESQSEAGGDEDVPAYIPNETETVDQEIFYKTTAGVNLRKEPSTDASIVTVLPENAQVRYISEDNEWTEVEYEGNTGFVSSQFLEPVAQAVEPESETEPESEASAPKQEEKNIDRSQFVVVLDPGHQAHGDETKEPNGPNSKESKKRVSSGTKGTTTGIYEFELNLDIALQVKDELESRGYTVFMTRSSHDVNISNKERAEYATSVNGNIFVRIHANGSDSSSVTGALALAPSAKNPYIANLSEDSTKLSECILNSYCDATGMSNHGVRGDDSMSGINWSTIPVTILEMGYMTCPSDDKNMQDDAYQLKMVKGIADGIDKYFGL